MKKIVIYLLILCFFFLPLNLFAKDKEVVYTNKYYSYQLDTYIYPMIKNHLKEYDRIFSKDEAKEICSYVEKNIYKICGERKIPICAKPNIKIVLLKDEKTAVYLLQVIIAFFDEEESADDLTCYITYAKRFLIYLYKIKDNKVARLY